MKTLKSRCEGTFKKKTCHNRQQLTKRGFRDAKSTYWGGIKFVQDKVCLSKFASIKIGPKLMLVNLVHSPWKEECHG